MKIRTALLLTSFFLMACAVAQAQGYGEDNKKYVAIRPDLVALGAKKISSDGKIIKVEVRFGNAGTKGAGSFKVLAYCEWEPKQPKDTQGGITIGGSVVYLGYPIQSLAVKQTKVYVTQCIKPYPEATSVAFKVLVDFEDKVAELSETNNKYNTAFRLR